MRREEILVDYSNEGQYFFVCLRVDKIPSVNDLYDVNPKTKRKYLTKKGVIFKHQIKEQLRISEIRKLCTWIKPGLQYYLQAEFVFKSSFETRDTTNCIKAFEDAVSEHIGVNDNRNFEVYLCKSYIDKSDYEFVNLRLTISHHDSKYYSKRS